eukprot:UN09655
MSSRNQPHNQVRAFAMDHFMNSRPAKTHRSEPIPAEENLLIEGSENLMTLLNENQEHLMFVLQNIP